MSAVQYKQKLFNFRYRSQLQSPHGPHDLLPTQCLVDDLVSNNATVENVLLYYRRRRRCACWGKQKSWPMGARRIRQ